MSFRQAARRLAPLSAPSPTPCSRPAKVRHAGATIAQRRNKWSLDKLRSWALGRPGKPDQGGDLKEQVGLELEDPEKRAEFRRRQLQRTSEGSIFEDDAEKRKKLARELPSSAAGETAVPKTQEVLAMATDPNPRGRVRWHRKKVIQMVRSNDHITRKQKIKMTERELLHKSAFLPTSVKKLVMLSRQIAGKTIDDAIVQMRWSKKKMSREMLYYLEEARDLAVAQRGMGLGKVKGEVLEKPRKVTDKDGKWIEVTDPTRIYIAQSWVGRGTPIATSIDYKARGRGCALVHPKTSFSVLLKEEKTRIRQHEEQKAREAAKGPWVHLPNRPLHGQRPYYTW
ncbi:hypothetical protein L249_4794 [Ophiocordyceps polyrhachis-furcata BCC 54312]|uniref:Mitochondrial large ribosomal subunit n=1 Tax=Ophiocordyceps polyrhachis-furcata BCC 54312 TaxID=1330021 RepID=A0A367L2J0_9HYPO|nr:hypothetical protein L249_4794 [Ophiocordyceps polyrhachis-furcata BCC 54312]